MMMTKIQTPTIRLSDRALLVSLSISQWTARKLDKRETQALGRLHHQRDADLREDRQDAQGWPAQ